MLIAQMAILGFLILKVSLISFRHLTTRFNPNSAWMQLNSDVQNYITKDFFTIMNNQSRPSHGHLLFYFIKLQCMY